MSPRPTLRVGVIGQRSMSLGQKTIFRSHLTSSFDHVVFEVKGHLDQDKRSHGSRSKVNLEGQGQRSPDQNVISGLSGNVRGQSSHGLSPA